MDKNDLILIYIHNIGSNVENMFTYNFYFVDKKLKLCNENWTESLAGLFNDKFIPDSNTVTKTLSTKIPLANISNNLCLGMKHAIDNIVALAWEDISDYEEYPEDGRLILYYGMHLNEIIELLSNKNLTFEN